MKTNKSAAILATVLLLYSVSAAAQLSFHDPATNQGVLDQVISQFSTKAAAWKDAVMAAASWLFWTLGTISFTWTMGMLALKKADISDFFSEFIRFTLFFGFFYWLLQNGPNFAQSIISSMMKIGSNAGGATDLSPSGIVDIGFMIWKQAITSLTVWQPIDSFIGVALSAGIMLLLAVVAVNMLLLLISAWILMYAGIFFLGFGGSKWTSDIAINYFKTVLGVGVQLFAMVLLIGIGNDMLSAFYAKMNMGSLNFEELGVMLVFCLALLMLVSKVPPLLAGVITGGGGGGSSSGIGNFSVGAAAGAAITAASMGGAAVAAGVTGAAGGAQALMAAFSSANAAESAGGGVGDMMAAAGSGSGGDGSSGGGLAAAMGDSGGGASAAMSDFSNPASSAGGAESGKTDSGSGGDSNGKNGAAGASGAGSDSKAGGAPGEVKSGSAMSSAAAMAAKAGRVAAGTASNLAQGSWDV
ncbi:MAG: P-type conjugative transfer protein TrbL, partial [Rhodoferax sp.]